MEFRLRAKQTDAIEACNMRGLATKYVVTGAWAIFVTLQQKKLQF